MVNTHYTVVPRLRASGTVTTALQRETFTLHSLSEQHIRRCFEACNWYMWRCAVCCGQKYGGMKYDVNTSNCNNQVPLHIPLIISHSSYQMVASFIAVACSPLRPDTSFQTHSTNWSSKNTNEELLTIMCKIKIYSQDSLIYVTLSSSSWRFGDRNVLFYRCYSGIVCCAVQR